MRIVVLLLLAIRVYAVEPTPLIHERGIAVTVAVADAADGRAVLVARFVPDRQDPPLHLYSKDLTGTLGHPTRIAIAAGEAVRPIGPLTDDQPAHLSADDLLIYPEGQPVTLRLPIALPPGPAGSTVKLALVIDADACSEKGCLQPINARKVVIDVPASGRVADAEVPATATTGDPGALTAVVRAAVADEVAKQFAAANDRSGIRFQKPTSVAQAEAMIDAAHAAGKSALLDFTGPSCNVCQRMAKTVLRLPPVAVAWNVQAPIEIDTDTYEDLAQWQQQRFATQNRPLYVRVDAGGKEERWARPFAVDDRATTDAFLAFLHGGAGNDIGKVEGLGALLILAVIGGLFTLLMPCTYPMIPFTINFFAKQAAGGHRVLPLAAAYAFGIIGCFTGLGVVVTGVFGSTLSTVSGNPYTNFVLAALFLLLGLSLLGAFLLRLPSSFGNALGGGRGGYLGALVMGLTFAVTAFACTAPFAGYVLAAAVASGSASGWARAVGGMAVYSGTIAVPFFLLASSPRLLTRLPRAGAWMNEFKVVGGLVEIAAALKFLVICDYHWHWGVFGRASVTALWAALAGLISVYILGRIRTTSDEPIATVGAGRLIIATLFLALAVWLAAGLCGGDLGVLESFFPG